MNQPASGAATTREAALSPFLALEAGDAETFLAAVSDDVTWTVLGDHPVAGEYHSKAEFLEKVLVPLGARLRDGLHQNYQRIVVEGECVAIDSLVSGTQNNGEPYNVRACFLSRYQDGKIVETVEYIIGDRVIRETFANNAPAE